MKTPTERAFELAITLQASAERERDEAETEALHIETLIKHTPPTDEEAHQNLSARLADVQADQVRKAAQAVRCAATTDELKSAVTPSAPASPAKSKK